MKLTFLIKFIFFLTIFNSYAIDAKLRRNNDQLLSFFDFVNVFQKKIMTNSLSKLDLQVIQLMSKIISIRQKKLDDEENSKPIVYWHLRQGR